MGNNIACIAAMAIMFLCAACGGNQKAADPSLQNKLMAMDSINEKTEHNKRLAKLWIEDAWNNNRNKEVVDQVFAQDWVDGNPTFPDQPKGIAGAMYFVDQYRAALGDIHFTMTHLIADADYVTFRFEATAKHIGPLLGVAATGKQVKITGIVIHKVVNGRFAMSWNEVDLLGLKMQLEQQ